MGSSNLRALLRLSICLAFATVNCDSTSTVNGKPEYSGTAVASAPNGAPTLIYNCAKMPAICKNVARRNGLDLNANGNPTGVTGGNIVLNFDTDYGRHKQRNAEMCPNSWKNSHPCPEVGQPNTVPQGSSYGNSYPAVRFNPNNNVKPGSTGYNRIANLAGSYSGMIWTCDEWPPAM